MDIKDFYFDEPTELHKELWKLYGIYFGYPKCCVNAFIKGRFWNHLPEKLKPKCKGKGFVPCKRCCNKILKNNLKIKSLIKNRICKTKYPDSPINITSSLIDTIEILKLKTHEY